MKINYLLVSALAEATSNLTGELTRRIEDTGCNIDDANFSLLGQESTSTMLVTGTWDAIAKLETALNRLASQAEYHIKCKRTEAKTVKNDHIPYLVEVIAADKLGIVRNLCDFFIARKITIENLTTARYLAVQTSAPMFSAQMTLAVPISQQISMLREEFVDFCDHLNLDAIIEPIKN